MQDIISSSEAYDILRPYCRMDFENYVQELQRSSLFGPADVRSIKLSCNEFRFSMNECNVLESFGELKELKDFADGNW